MAINYSRRAFVTGGAAALVAAEPAIRSTFSRLYYFFANPRGGIDRLASQEGLEGRLDGSAHAQQRNAGDALPKQNSGVDYDGLAKQAAELVRKRKYQEARDILKPYENDPANNNTAFYNTYATSHEGLKDSTMAEKWYLKAIDLNPTNYIARINLASLYIDQGRKEEAKQQFKVILEFDPNNKMASSLLKRLQEGKL